MFSSCKELLVQILISLLNEAIYTKTHDKEASNYTTNNDEKQIGAGIRLNLCDHWSNALNWDEVKISSLISRDAYFYITSRADFLDVLFCFANCCIHLHNKVWCARVLDDVIILRYIFDIDLLFFIGLAVPTYHSVARHILICDPQLLKVNSPLLPILIAIEWQR